MVSQSTDVRLYDCTTCGVKTVFRQGCGPCDDKLMAIEDLEAAKRRLGDIDKEIVALKFEKEQLTRKIEVLKEKSR